MKILIADDSKQIRELIKSMLSNAGHIIYECKDGREVVELFSIHHPDLVLMDIAMEKMDGLEASKTILQKHPEAKILIVTQYKEPSLMNEAKRIGTIGYLLKDDLSMILDYVN